MDGRTDYERLQIVQVSYGLAVSRTSCKNAKTTQETTIFWSTLLIKAHECALRTLKIKPAHQLLRLLRRLRPDGVPVAKRPVLPPGADTGTRNRSATTLATIQCRQQAWRCWGALGSENINRERWDDIDGNQQRQMGLSRSGGHICAYSHEPGWKDFIPQRNAEQAGTTTLVSRVVGKRSL